MALIACRTWKDKAIHGITQLGQIKQMWLLRWRQRVSFRELGHEELKNNEHFLN